MSATGFLNVHGPPGSDFVALEVLDARRRPLRTGNHLLHIELEPGLYLARARHPGVDLERVVAVREGEISDVKFAPLAPLPRSRLSAALERTAPGGVVVAAAAPVSVLDTAGRPRFSLSRGSGWFELEAGAHVLEVETPEGRRRQPLPALASCGLQALIDRDGAVRLYTARSMHDAAAMDAALEGLARGAVVLAPADRRRFADGELEDPLLALVAAFAHLLSDEPDPVRKALPALTALLPNVPDVRVLALLTGAHEVEPFDAPPLLAYATDRLIGAALPRPDLILPRGQLDGAIPRLRPDGPWTRWDGELTADQARRELARMAVAAVGRRPHRADAATLRIPATVLAQLDYSSVRILARKVVGALPGVPSLSRVLATGRSIAAVAARWEVGGNLPGFREAPSPAAVSERLGLEPGEPCSRTSAAAAGWGRSDVDVEPVREWPGAAPYRWARRCVIVREWLTPAAAVGGVPVALGHPGGPRVLDGSGLEGRWSIDMDGLRLVALTAGERRTLSRGDGEWLLEQAAGPLPKVLLTDCALREDGHRRPLLIDWADDGAPEPGLQSVDMIVRRAGFVAAIGSGAGGYQRFTSPLDDGGAIEYVALRGAGPPAMHLAEADEDAFRCYPTRGDSLAYAAMHHGGRLVRALNIALLALVAAVALLVAASAVEGSASHAVTAAAVVLSTAVCGYFLHAAVAIQRELARLGDRVQSRFEGKMMVAAAAAAAAAVPVAVAVAVYEFSSWPGFVLGAGAVAAGLVVALLPSAAGAALGGAFAVAGAAAFSGVSGLDTAGTAALGVAIAGAVAVLAVLAVGGRRALLDLWRDRRLDPDAAVSYLHYLGVSETLPDPDDRERPARVGDFDYRAARICELLRGGKRGPRGRLAGLSRRGRPARGLPLLDSFVSLELGRDVLTLTCHAVTGLREHETHAPREDRVEIALRGRDGRALER